MPRKYSSIWKALKSSGACAIAAPVPLHARIIKAVIKEKYMDLGFKMKASEARKYYKIEHEISGSRISFKMTAYSILKDLNFGEL